jgi:hypothetical protein
VRTLGPSKCGQGVQIPSVGWGFEPRDSMPSIVKDKVDRLDVGASDNFPENSRWLARSEASVSAESRESGAIRALHTLVHT